MIDFQGPAEPVRFSQLAMKCKHGFQFLAYTRRERRTSTGSEVYVHAQTLIPGHQSTVIPMVHGMQVVDSLMVHVDQLARHAQRFSFEYLTEIINIQP